MKKVLMCLIAILLITPMIIKADTVVVENHPYEVEVLKETVPYYKYGEDKGYVQSGVLRKGDKITIIFEITEKGIKYGEFEARGYEYFVKLSDVFARGEIDPKTAQGVRQYEEDTYLLVTNEVIARKGPSDAYEEVGKIKDKELLILYYYYDGDYFYVESGDVKGWIPYSENVWRYKKDYLVFRDLKNSCGDFKYGDVLKDVYINGIGEYLLNANTNACIFKYSPYDEEDEHIVDFADPVKIYKITSELKMKETLQPDSKEITLKVGDELKYITDTYVLYENNYYLYVEYNGQTGWINGDNGDEGLELVRTEPRTPVEPKEQPKEEPKEEKEKKEMDTRTIVLICVILALTIGLAALGLIMLYNRKKAELINEQMD